MIQEGSSAINAARIYVHGAGVDQIVASQVSSGEWRYHHYDGQGNCILLTDTSGAIREQYDYDAFGMPYVYSAGGAPLGAATQWGNRFLFTGREWLSELRIYDYRARQYQPELGRFLQPDPQEFDGGDYNLYRYCHNDPVNNIDPLGLLHFKFDPSFPKDAEEQFDEAMKVLRTTERGRQLDADPRTIVITATYFKHPTQSLRNTIYLNPNDPLFLDAESRHDFSRSRNELPPANVKGRAIIIGHEIGHFVNNDKDEHLGGHNVERNENPIRHGLGIHRRETYSGKRVPPRTRPLPPPPRPDPSPPRVEPEPSIIFDNSKLKQ